MDNEIFDLVGTNKRQTGRCNKIFTYNTRESYPCARILGQTPGSIRCNFGCGKFCLSCTCTPNGIYCVGTGDQCKSKLRNKRLDK
jgi:hypothetical protein